MKKKILKWAMGIVLFVNLPLWDFFTKEEYTYRNYDGSFFYSEISGTGLSSAERLYGMFLCRNPQKEQVDNTLYRTFTIRPWRFWQWREMVFHIERFGLPYLQEEDLRVPR